MRRLVALTVVSLLLFGTAACGDDAGDKTAKPEVDMGETLKSVSITGDVGTLPEVEIDAPLKLEKSASQVITAGDGDVVVEGEQALLHLYVANGTSGEKAAATYDEGQPVNLQMSDDQLFPAVLDAIVGKPAGSRVAISAIPADAYGAAGAEQMGLKGTDNVVFVVDIMSVEPKDVLDGPKGDAAADAPSDIPTVEEKDGDVTNLTFEKAPKTPAGELEVITLIEGEGEPARKASLVTFDYFGQVYGTDQVFDESFSKEPVTFPLGTGGLIKGWDEGLVGVKAGSRVMIIAPPDFAYGEQGSPPKIPADATLAFVVDILGVS